MGRIFRFEMNLEQALELEREKRTGEVMSALLSTSLDPVSPGYPYCLVHADTMARVTGDEASMLRALAVSSAFDAGLGDMLQDIVESVDYHDVLNTFVGGVATVASEVAGQIIGGTMGEVLIREKSDSNIELGDLLVTGTKESFTILQVFDIRYGSQIPELTRELAAGLILEGRGGRG